MRYKYRKFVQTAATLGILVTCACSSQGSGPGGGGGIGGSGGFSLSGRTGGGPQSGAAGNGSLGGGSGGSSTASINNEPQIDPEGAAVVAQFGAAIGGVVDPDVTPEAIVRAENEEAAIIAGGQD